MHNQLVSTEASCSLFLPLVWQTADSHRQTRIAVEAGIEALLSLPEPFSLAFVMRLGSDTSASAGWVVRGTDPASTDAAARDVKDVLGSVIAWQGMGDAVLYESAADQSNWYALEPADGPGREIVNVRSVAWSMALRRPSATTMIVELHRNTDIDGRPGVQCSVAVNGDGTTASIVASLLAADPPGKLRLVATPIASQHDAPIIDLPLKMAAHLIASPARTANAWPDQRRSSLRELFDRWDETVPPHTVVFGGSGQGKTTLLEHHQMHAARAGRPRAVLCPHGDLAARGLPIAERNDDRFVFYDFGDPAQPARWNLTAPPTGMDPRSWAVELVRVIKTSFRNRNDEWFGPVGSKALRVACEVLTRDEINGITQPITRLADLLDPTQKEEWTEALDRIDDPTLAHEMRRVWSMIANDRQSHTGVWLTSKVEPFVADPRIAAVVGSTESDVDASALARGVTMLVSAPTSRLGDEGSNLLLGTMLAQIWHHLRARSGEETVDLYIDELQRFAPETLLALLPESRKHGVNLRLATQTPNNLDPTVRDAVLSNCGAVSTFRLGTRDAAILEPLFPQSPVSSLTRAARYELRTSFGDDELLTETEPALTWS